ncbi:haloacid dehalogenase-like hydrolase [Minicystis rosea]|nr:haloacid dehalogenase-like hydrolase [Minicystis rosea]
MRSIDALTASEARRLVGLVFDLDDTLLDHGELTEEAYGALFRLRAAGLRLVACTGRPAGWGEVVERQWPIDAAVTENGAVAFIAERGAGGVRQVVSLDPLGRTERQARRSELLRLADEIVGRFPKAALADDNDARRADVTLDIGEHRRVPADEVRAIRDLARERGVRTFTSSIHLHLTHEADDKATGTIRLLVERFGEDATNARSRWGFVGDSANDAAAFAAFRLTFGVANVRLHVRGLTVPPRYVAHSSMGRGFAEIASRLAALRASDA